MNDRDEPTRKKAVCSRQSECPPGWSTFKSLQGRPSSGETRRHGISVQGLQHTYVPQKNGHGNGQYHNFDFTYISLP